jgi:YHS domain-containing protein
MAPIAALVLLLQSAPATTKEALKPFQALVGTWRCTGQVKETKQDPWTEAASWAYRIEKEDYRLVMTSADGVAWRRLELRYDLGKKAYFAEAIRPDGSTTSYCVIHRPKEKELQLDTPAKAWPAERATFSLLHDNRFFITFERQAAEGRPWTAVSDLGCTKEGVPFVRGQGPVCIITGGQGSIAVTYRGRTYYVCCNGCKAEFEADPEKALETARKEGRLNP